MSDRRIDTFTICQPGIEAIAEGELVHLGITGRVTHGGVIASMTWSQLALAHLHLRTATRVLVRVGRFDATNWGPFAAGLRRVDWAAWLAPGADVDVRVSATASKLYHSGAIEERVREVLPPPSAGGGHQRLAVRIDHDLVTLSLDASGDPLYQRGWRAEAVDAPIRETLAAALVRWSGWDAKAPLVDPCCGSGTIAIEAAMLARRIPPGRHRSFSWQRWPAAAGVDWSKLVAAAEADVRPSGPAVFASDVDRAAVTMTSRNAQRAGVSVEVTTAAVDEVKRPPRAGFVVTNPPYGTRLDAPLRAVYEAVGRLAMPPWRLAVVAAVGTPTSAFGREWADSLLTKNGGIPVRFLRA
jgi:putative N6-adenine-specific DNA methylase